jgi:peroxiredoxin
MGMMAGILGAIVLIAAVAFFVSRKPKAPPAADNASAAVSQDSSRTVSATPRENNQSSADQFWKNVTPPVPTANPSLQAISVSLGWMPRGFSEKQGFYRPLQANLTTVKPSNVTKLPDGVGEAMYATLPFGPANAGKKVVVLLDESIPDKSRLWLDANGNGDLTDDPAPTWTSRTSQTGGLTLTQWNGTASVPLDYGAQRRDLGLKLYRFDKSDPKRTGFKTILFYYRDFGPAGKVTISDKMYVALLGDDKARGDFTASGDVRFSLDLNGDGRFDSRSESFSTNQPFNIGGTTYELTGLKTDGTSFQIVKSDKKVAERVVPLAIKIGGKTPPFEDKTTEGASVRFPQDYKGKIVMLDFWAMWCPPCVAELPNLTKVYDEFHAKGFEMLGISLDSQPTLSKLKQFNQDHGMAWPQIADGKVWEARLAGLYGVRSIPSAFLVDGNSGNIVGSGNELRGTALRGSVERALADLAKSPSIATDPRLAQLESGFKARYESDAQRPYLASVASLNQSYVANGIAQARAAAQGSGSVQDVAALDAEKERIAKGLGVPDEDDPATPDVLKKLRATYRGTMKTYAMTRDRNAEPIRAIYLRELDGYIAELTSQGKTDHTKMVQTLRDNVAVGR